MGPFRAIDFHIPTSRKRMPSPGYPLDGFSPLICLRTADFWDEFGDETATKARVAHIKCAVPPNVSHDVVEGYSVGLSCLSERQLASRYVDLFRRLGSPTVTLDKTDTLGDHRSRYLRRLGIKPLGLFGSCYSTRDIDVLTEELRRVHNLWALLSAAWFISPCGSVDLADWLSRLREAIQLVAAIDADPETNGSVREIRLRRAQRRTKRRVFLESQFGENRVVLIRNRNRFERCGGLRVLLGKTSGRCRLLGEGGAGFRGGRCDGSPRLRGAKAA